MKQCLEGGFYWRKINGKGGGKGKPGYGDRRSRREERTEREWVGREKER